MRLRLTGAASAVLALSVASCTDAARNPVSPGAASFNVGAASDAVWISEIHYDNASTDVGEAVEVTGPAGKDLTGWQIVLYNGNGGATYTPLRTLSGTIPATCGTHGVLVATYPSNGIQNGNPDGVALVDAAGKVVEFLSYGGSFTAVGGPANGMTSMNIGVAETGSTPVGHSLQRDGSAWKAPAPNSFGACNGGPPPPAGPTTLVIHELMGAPLAAESESWGEWFEVYNYGTEAVNLAGWKIRSGGDAEHTVSASVVVPAGGYAVLGRADDVSRNGGVAVDYNYFSGSSTTVWMGESDWLALRSPAGATVDSVRWSTLPKGATRALRDAAADNTDADGAGWGFSLAPYGSGDFGTPDAPNTGLSDVAPPVPTGVVRISFTGRTAADPALPAGFQDQLFATARRAGGVVDATPLVWSSATPALASVDQRGVVTARGAGIAIIQATSQDGRVGTYALPTRLPVASATADYRGNAEFGEPTDADAGDDFLIRYGQLTSSFSPTRGTPNWVSYNLEASHFGAEDRCDCFTPDPGLPAGFPEVSTADYTGAGAYHGFGIDRGHLARSADRTAGSLDNAVSFYFSNIIPQAADNNQGPWSVLETLLGNQARAGGREVYVITGVAGSQGTLKDEGKIVIPGSVWKVAVVMGRNQGLADIDDGADFELIAVEMPNTAGIRNVDWNTYRTTVNAIEASAGYDLLALLPNHIEWLVEDGLSTAQGVSAERLLAVLSGGIGEMTARGALRDGNGNALLAKLEAAGQQIAAGNATAARGPLNAFENQVRALERSGHLAADEAASLRIVAGWVENALR